MTAAIPPVYESWSPMRRQRAADRIAQLARRQRIIDAVGHPAALAASCDPDYVITPAIELVSKNIERVLRSRRRRLMITAPPQEFKSRLCAVWTPLRALQLHPDWRVMLLTYADGLAEEHSTAARGLIQEFGSGVVDTLTGAALPDKLGLSLSPDKATAGNWRINEGDGGLVAAGRDATITGRRADLLIVDDPFKNMQEADSAAIRAKVLDWYRSVATTRLAPGASVILIQTRWHPEDLAGDLLKADRELDPALREWRYINIPAIAHPAIPDALDRAPGEPLISARGRTLEDWRATERNVGKRIWNALYQGMPVPPEGGLFSQSWFDEHRVPELPSRTLARIVAIDPSESGEGDEAGIVAAALLPPRPDWDVAERGPYPEVALFADRSAPMTSAQWARTGVDLAVEVDASDIFVETYTAGLTYLNVVRSHIRARIEAERKKGAKADRALIRKLTLLHNRVRPWRGSGDAVARSGLLRQAVEVGTCVVIGQTMAEMEAQAKLWQAGQHQPDRVAASVIAHDRLIAMKGQVAQVAKPGSAPGASPNAAWLSRKVG